MSGHWMNAGDLFDGYRSGSFDPEGKASANSCRQVLRELCRIAHDAGVAQVSTERLADRLGLSLSTVKRALKRLRADGWITRPVKGTGNRQGTEPRQSVWVLRPLPDRSGRMLPGEDRRHAALVKYQQSTRFLSLSESLRLEVLRDWHRLNETGLELVPAEQVLKVGKPADLIAEYKAQKARARLKIVSPEPVQQSVSQTQQSVTTDPHYTRITISGPNEPGSERGSWPDRETQLAALAAMHDHCPTWHRFREATA